MTSDSQDQPNRPPMLASDSTPTKPAALAAVTAGKKPRIIGDAFSRMPMPAVTLVNRTTHRSQNWGVLIALLALTLPPVDSDRCLLYTSDAADDLLCVDLGGRRI